MSFDIYTTIVILGVIGGAGYVVKNLVDYLIKRESIKPQIIEKGAGGKGKKTHFQDMLDGLPMALQQSIAIYNQQLEMCQKQGLSTEDTQKVLKPLADKIKLMQSLTEHPVIAPLAQVGASVADTGANAIEKILKDVGDNIG